MQTLSPKIHTLLRVILVVMTVGLLAFEGQLLFASKSESLNAQAPGGNAAATQAVVPVQAAQDPVAAQNQGAAVPPASTLSADILATEDLKCLGIMRPFMEDERKSFAEFITQHFQSKKTTSELIPTAVLRLKQYRDTVRAKLNSFGVTGGKLSTVATREDGACRTAVEDEYKLAKELFTNHVLENAYAKKATRLIDVYKEINEQLNALNFDVAQLYGNFSTFSQKLPCYATQCQQQ